ncbi:hypothetical protein ABIE33_006993 [Ensifer sp. 4252]
MTAREVLLLIITAFLLTSLLLIYNSYYQPISTNDTGPPAVNDKSEVLVNFAPSER